MAKSPSEVIIGELTRIRTSMERLETQESASKDAFNTLYSEMEDYKKRAIFDLEKHILNDLLIFFDSLVWTVQNSTDQENSQNIYDDFLEMLSRYEVAPFPKVNSFDPKLHRVLQVVPTEDPNLDGQIVSVLKQGFYRRDQILRIEDVTIYQCKAK